MVKKEPAAVVFRFDEPVEGNFGAVRVYDSSGERVDEGDAFHPNGEGPKLGVHLKPNLPEGSYTATYRVVSADGHIVSSGYVFSIGKAGRAPTQTVAELIGGGGTGPVTEMAYGIARGLEYRRSPSPSAASSSCWLSGCRPPAGRRGGGRVGEADVRRPACGSSSRSPPRSGLLAAAAQIVLEGAEAAGITGFSALKWSIVSETLGTNFGSVMGWAVVAWVVFAVGVALLLRDRRARLALAIPLAYLVISPALGGHASTQSPVVLNFPVNVVHVGAMAIWLGGLAALLLVLPAATRGAAESRPQPRPRRRDLPLPPDRPGDGRRPPRHRPRPGLRLRPPPRRPRLDRLRPRRPRQVPAGADRDRLRRLQPAPLGPPVAGGSRSGAGRPAAGVLLRRALRAEVAVLWSSSASPRCSPATPPRSRPRAAPLDTTDVGPTQLEMTVDPARVGANQIHLFLFDSKTGAQYTRPRN